MTPRLLLAALGLIAFALPAHADGAMQKLITAADTGDVADLKQLDELLARPLVAFSDKDLTGNWKCRTIKVGGLSPLVIYGWFRCKVTDDGSGWKLEKTTGSQRTTGRFFDESEKRAIYLGSGSVNEDKPKPYGSGPETDQVGYAFRNSATEWRIELPAPYYESKLDIMEFKR